MRSALLYVLAAAFLVLIVSLAWLTRASTFTPHVVERGETVAQIAEDFGIKAEALATANDADSPETMQLTPGERILVPAAEPTGLAVWTVHGAGLLSELIGVLLSFWLAAMIGLLPKNIRKQVFGISLVLAIVSYAAAQAVATQTPLLTPQFVFSALKDGFMWSAAFPMLARMIGIKEGEALVMEDPPAPAARDAEGELPGANDGKQAG